MTYVITLKLIGLSAALIIVGIVLVASAIISHTSYLDTFSSYLKIKEIEDNCVHTVPKSYECDTKTVPPLYDPTIMPSAAIGLSLIAAATALLVMNWKGHNLTRLLQ